MSAPEERKVRSLAELPAAIEPGRDLWPAIEARLKSPALPPQAAAAGAPHAAALAGSRRHGGERRGGGVDRPGPVAAAGRRHRVGAAHRAAARSPRAPRSMRPT